MPKAPQQHLNADQTHVYLEHPDLDEGWWAPLGVAQTYVDARDFVYATPPDTSLQGLFDDATAEGSGQTGFDPGAPGVTVKQVNDHLEAMHAAGADGEVARVLALEFADGGQQRTTVKDPRPSVVDDDSNDPNRTNG